MPLPKENLDNKTFDELSREALARVRAHVKEWTNHNPSDPGVAFVELFAWLTEMELYRLNRITEENSRKFLKLMDYDETQPESLEDAMERAGRDFKTVYRAVTADDYEHLVMAIPDLRVARVRAIPNYYFEYDREVPGVHTIIVVPESDNSRPVPSPDFLKTIYAHLWEKRMLTTEFFVVKPLYVRASVEAVAVIKPNYTREGIRRKVIEKLNNFLHPITGGEDGSGWTFGRFVYVSEIYQLMEKVAGVDYVRAGSVKLLMEGKAQEGDAAIPRHALVYSEDHTITVEE